MSAPRPSWLKVSGGCSIAAKARKCRSRARGFRFIAWRGFFITHLHGDHFNGLAGLLLTMALDKRERELAMIAGPPGIGEYLDVMRHLKILWTNYPLVLCEYGKQNFADAAQIQVYDSERFTIVTRPLDHRIFALGYRVQEKDRLGKFDLARAKELEIPAGPLFGKLQRGESITLPDGRVIESCEIVGAPRPGNSVAYVLDTRPCENAVLLARDVDWLIHEATFSEALLDEAANYGHSTAQQAARTALDAGAQRLLITHFSSRYPDASLLLTEARAIFPATTMARDLMEIEV